MMSKLVLVIFLVIVLVIALFGASPYKSAEQPGFLPNNLFYSLKLFREQAEIMLTAGNEKLVLKYIELANIRVVEAKIMYDREKYKHIEKALNRYEINLNKANNLTNQALNYEADKEKMRIQIEATRDKNKWTIDLIKEKIPEKEPNSEPFNLRSWLKGIFGME